MPLDLPTFDSLKERAKIWKFRQPNEFESEGAYRKAFSEFVRPQDPVESCEILFGKGWDRWSDEEKLTSLTYLLKR
jgi:hypothetical protein